MPVILKSAGPPGGSTSIATLGSTQSGSPSALAASAIARAAASSTLLTQVRLAATCNARAAVTANLAGALPITLAASPAARASVTAALTTAAGVPVPTGDTFIPATQLLLTGSLYTLDGIIVKNRGYLLRKVTETGVISGTYAVNQDTYLLGVEFIVQQGTPRAEVLIEKTTNNGATWSPVVTFRLDTTGDIATPVGSPIRIIGMAMRARVVNIIGGQCQLSVWAK